MDTLTCRLLPYAVADGPTNMAADEVLLQAAAHGVASLRFYGWTEATLSLGYFQPAAVRLADPRLAALPWVRRATGGATLVHDHELTYALALPAGPPWQPRGSWMKRMHGIIHRALEGLGLEGKVASAEMTKCHGDVLCFEQMTPGDLLCEGAKVVGSAQRKHHHCLLQHGAILLAHSAHAPQLPGIRELVGRDIAAETLLAAIQAEMDRETGWSFGAVPWTEMERRAIDDLTNSKYRAPIWNEKRQGEPGA